MDRLEADTPLRGLDNSLSGTRLRLGLRRLGFLAPLLKVPATFGELERLLAGDHALPVGEHPVNAKQRLAPSPEPASFRIGHDIQDVQSLPDATDYWDHEFYLGSFSGAELAYAVILSEPKQHFAGFWASKEALKKCEPSFLDVDLRELTVAHNADGSPYFFLVTPSGGIRLTHGLSISHAGNTASAVVLAAATAPI
jgi:phosphopantetheinyl transferase (holo-ACP synthase)